MRTTTKNEAIIALITFFEAVVYQWQASMATIDPEYGYLNEINEEKAAQVKEEFRELLNAILDD